MKFTNIYNRIIILWSEEILISDGYQTDKDKGSESTPSNAPLGGESYYFPTLSNVWGQVEDLVGHEDTWGDMMVWTMFQIFHAKSKEMLEAGAKHLNTREVPPSLFEEQYFLNLQSEGWEEERLAYERA